MAKKAPAPPEPPAPIYTDDFNAAWGDAVVRVALGGDELHDVHHHHPREQRIVVRGRVYYHASDDPTGVWVYRAHGQ